MNRGHYQVLNGGADVFRCIAAEWKSIDPESVNDNLRQQAKQVQLGRRETVTWTRMHSHGCCLCRFAMALSMGWELSLWGSKWEWRRTTRPATSRVLRLDTKVYTAV